MHRRAVRQARNSTRWSPRRRRPCLQGGHAERLRPELQLRDDGYTDRSEGVPISDVTPYAVAMAIPPPVAAAALMRAHRRGLAVSERKLLLASGDAIAVAAAFLLAFNLHAAEVRHMGLAVPRVALGIVLVVFLVSAYLADAYRLAGAVNLRDTFRSIAGSMAISFVGLLGVFFVVPYRITRPTLLLWVPLAAVALMAWRLVCRRVFAQAIFAGSVVVVADPSSFRQVWPDAAGVMRGLYRVVDVVSPSRPDCADIVQELAAEGQVNQIILGIRGEVPRDIFRALLECYDRGVPVRSLSDLYEELTGRMLLDQLGHSWLLSLPMRSETSRIYGAFKRGFDILAASAGLLLLAVVAPLLWLAVKVEDGGPLIYRQERLGKYAKPFTIFKLRTMHEERRAKQRQTDAGDERITRIGGVVRKLHIDELPQAWNILKGEMSMIGPRPEQPAYVATLQKAIDFYNTRLSVRPGLTGWAQVNLGYADGVEGARKKLSYDLYYIKRQSAALDLLILARTLFAVLSLGGR
jgi:exopolysaccharide biosynthesis polyprenyl glycosylphosphotransferase